MYVDLLGFSFYHRYSLRDTCINACFLFFSVNDGVFRRYRGSRTLEDLQGYVLERKWEAVEPVAGWKSPSSIM